MLCMHRQCVSSKLAFLNIPASNARASSCSFFHFLFPIQAFLEPYLKLLQQVHVNNQVLGTLSWEGGTVFHSFRPVMHYLIFIIFNGGYRILVALHFIFK